MKGIASPFHPHLFIIIRKQIAHKIINTAIVPNLHTTVLFNIFTSKWLRKNKVILLYIFTQWKMKDPSCCQCIALPMHRGPLYTKGKYVSKGLICCAYRTSWQPITSNYIQRSSWAQHSTKSYTGPSYLKGHVMLTVWQWERKYALGVVPFAGSCPSHMQMCCRQICLWHMIRMRYTYSFLVFEGHTLRGI